MTNRSIRRKWRPCTFTVLVSLLLASCPLKLDLAMVQQVKDGVVPSISVSSPAEGSSYAATVVVSGIVTDFSTESGESGGLRSVVYTIIPETLPGGIVDFAGDGSFSFSFPTAGFSGPMVIRIVAEDWNGNTREVSISLVDGGAFATLTATPGNKLATLVWDDVALAESYSVHNLRYGEVENDVTSPFDWTGLTNGELYSFQISATSTQGDDNWSAIQDVIPLSTRTLAPDVVAQYRKIFVEWAQIPAADEYVVSRSIDPNGPFTTRTITGNTEFVDGNVLLDQEYYYRVRPFSQDCIESIANGAQPSPLPPERWYIVDTMVLPGSAYAVTIAGDLAYVAAYDAGLQVVDISDPTNMSIVGSASTSGGSQDIALSGDRAFLVGYSTDLDMIDISDPTYPLISTSWDSAWGAPYTIDVSGNSAYVAAWSGGLQVFNISGSGPFSAPMTVNIGATAGDVDVYGDVAYVADGGGGLHILHNLDPADPASGLTPLPGTANGVTVVDGLAYVADGGEGLQIVNATAPYNIVGATPTMTSAQHVAVSGDYAYVADTTDGLRIVDVSTPGTPVIVGSRATPGTAAEVAVSGTYAFVADEYSGLHAIDVSLPILPIVGAQPGIAGANCVAVSGDFAYVGGDNGLTVVDISVTGFPIEGSREIPVVEGEPGSYSIWAVAVAGNRVYAAAEEAGLVVIDTADSSYPIVGICDISGWAASVAISRSYAFVTDEDKGLQIIDISDPALPILAVVDALGEERDTAVAGDYAYVADSDGLVVIDIGDPTFPIVGSTPTPGYAESVAVRGDLAYVTEWDYGIRIVDVSDPTDPIVVGGTEIPGTPTAQSVTIVGAYALIANRDSGVVIVDISDPENSTPPIVGTRNTPISAWKIAISGRYAYVADANGGLQIIDLLGQ